MLKQETESPRSPCVGACELDAGTGLCRGCRRTMAEIAGWSAMTPAERQRVLDRLAAALHPGDHAYNPC